MNTEVNEISTLSTLVQCCFGDLPTPFCYSGATSVIPCIRKFPRAWEPRHAFGQAECFTRKTKALEEEQYVKLFSGDRSPCQHTLEDAVANSCPKIPTVGLNTILF